MATTAQKRLNLTIAKTIRYLEKVSDQPSAKNVHKFRTHSRRVETVLRELVSDSPRSQEKVVKQLGRLRKKAGRIRDLNVQIAALRNLKMPQAAAQKAELMRVLLEELAKREEQIGRLADKEVVREIRKRLKRAATDSVLPSDEELLLIATQKIEQLGRGEALTEETLHGYRVAGKKARYLAELVASSEAQQIIQQLKRMQDVLGEWHDWWQLAAKAENHLGSVEKTPLTAVLQNVTRAKFRQALAEVAETRNALLQKSEALSPRKPARASDHYHATAVA